MKITVTFNMFRDMMEEEYLERNTCILGFTDEVTVIYQDF